MVSDHKIVIVVAVITKMIVEKDFISFIWLMIAQTLKSH